jgi:glycosyltransferase involved in cell wall biosynthesis
MRITVVTGPFLPLPPESCGAVERVWDGLSKQFASLGHEVTMLSRSSGTSIPEEMVNGVRHIRRLCLRRTNRITLDLLKDLVYSVRMLSLLPSADIIVTNTFWLPIFVGCFQQNVGKLAVHVARFPKGQISLYRGAARFHAVSNHVRTELLREWPAASKLTRVIPNPIDTSIFTTPAAPRRASATYTILYTGRIHPEKGLDLLLDAFKKVYARYKYTKLRIVGPWKTASGGGGETYLDKLKTEAKDIPVEFGEAMNDAKALARELQAADIYCYPSLSEHGESFGIAPLEAMGTGLAPIVSDIPCFRDFLNHGVTGYVFDHRGDQAYIRLAEAIEKLLRDPVMAETMGARAAERAKQYSYENVASLYLDDFRDLLNVWPRSHRELP